MSELEMTIAMHSVMICIISGFIVTTRLKLDRAIRDIEWLKDMLEIWRKG